MRMPKSGMTLRQHMFDQRYMYLFIVLLIPYILHPLIETPEIGVAIMDGAFSLVLLVALFAVSTQTRVRYVALGLMLLAQVLIWSKTMFPGEAHSVVSIVVSGIYLVYTTIFLLVRILRRRDVTANTIFAALCVYLLIGYIWALLYSFLEITTPGSFYIDKDMFRYQFDVRHAYSDLYYFMYYSFTSLTTLGLGDIMPASPWSRVLTVMEAIIGQIYLVVLVSRLVGMHVSQRNQEL
jgi:hypothetical protein